MLFYAGKCTGCGRCKEKCPNRLEKCDLCGKCALYCPHDAREICGKAYTVEQVLGEVIKDKAFYETSGGGVTFSGGECMLQIDFLTEILKACKENGIHTAVDTAGHVSYDCFERILPYTDLFLYDVKCLDNEKHKKFVGVDNDRILANLRKLLEQGANVWVRVPVIPGVNDTVEEMKRLADFFDTAGWPEKVELLPYHAMGEHKYTALGREAESFLVPKEETMTRLRAVFAK
jgi:pyruvate formate lyase activating enzyme